MASGKRSATSELNHDNWDDEVETEEAGTFSQADESTLKGRVIKKAKRRGLASQVKCSLIVKIRQFRQNSPCISSFNLFILAVCL